MGQHYSSLSLEERTQLSPLREGKLSCAEMARQLGRSTSTITREFARHGNVDKGYRAAVAHSRSRASTAAARQNNLLCSDAYGALMVSVEEQK